ncbi:MULTISPECIES: acyl-CoA dehydrogenase family protein [unclassified Solwaraspora]|uniref:acyl-CoA dehydrogenase family protein n=1 Tax=unclassified Solwaraspora TaxID=2627926 RepID=UPI00248CFD34|nr:MULTISPECIES: acyl-CoA dehydrogenase family protein [unclassified Solwaraspora]WBB95650.1 acyl-CoA/acyl-ACP dehydrogenase [Solwaraspora sp. WMMA2059]WBC20446.1 acyl-CoA/acyl-ACP dehydrogenase [Solwaraspora sp. WMMA2080]WJK37401.1 acyl-CoA dehydrogenase family protein [Solwaraspora sp. WMMA2065]
MRSLDIARAACEKFHPGLCGALADTSLSVHESAQATSIKTYRAHGGAGLLVPEAYGGAGADALDAVRVIRAISAYTPSLGAAVTMHHFTAAMLFALAGTAGRLTGTQLSLLGRMAPEGLLMASGWAEGRPNANILTPSVSARPVSGGYLVSGGKKPCSLSTSMDLLTASAAVPDVDGRPSLAVLLIPADSPGVSVHPFWSTYVLAGAESNEVRLADVHVPEDLVIRTAPDDPDRLDDLQTAGFVWFELMITSVYLGAASALVERVLANGRGSVTDRARMTIRLESAIAGVEGVARAVLDGVDGDEAVAAVLIARYAAQDAIRQATDLAVELSGGMSFITSSDDAYLTAAARPLAFHPPSQASAAEPLVDYFAGRPLVLS